ncbi:MAG TPA: hypothetical protein VGE60_09015 [Telluria sp.]
MKRVLSIAAMLAAVGVASAQTITTPADAFNVGKDFANTGKGVAGGKINGATGSNVLPYYSTTAPETANFQEGRNLIGGAGTNKQIQCETYKAPNAFQQQECDAVNFMSKNPTQRPKFTIDKQTDPILTGSKGVINNPGSIPGASTQQCRVERVKNPATYITETCTETQTLENLSCKRVLKVACDPERDGCDQGGIVPNSWAGDMATSFTPDGAGNYILQFGTIADNYWGGYGAVYDRNLTFDIRDVGLITRFALTRAAYDDWLMVKVNGTTVYVGPRGGDRLDVVQQCAWTDWETGQCAYYSNVVQYCATCFSGPELSTSWNFGLNIDVKPYLKNGSNTIFMRTVVAGGGEGAIQLTTRQLCPRNCYDQWDNSQCAPLEQRAQ